MSRSVDRVDERRKRRHLISRLVVSSSLLRSQKERKRFSAQTVSRVFWSSGPDLVSSSVRSFSSTSSSGARCEFRIWSTARTPSSLSPSSPSHTPHTTEHQMRIIWWDQWESAARCISDSLRIKSRGKTENDQITSACAAEPSLYLWEPNETHEQKGKKRFIINEWANEWMPNSFFFPSHFHLLTCSMKRGTDYRQTHRLTTHLSDSFPSHSFVTWTSEDDENDHKRKSEIRKETLVSTRGSVWVEEKLRNHDYIVDLRNDGHKFRRREKKDGVVKTSAGRDFFSLISCHRISLCCCNTFFPTLLSSALTSHRSPSPHRFGCQCIPAFLQHLPNRQDSFDSQHLRGKREGTTRCKFINKRNSHVKVRSLSCRNTYTRHTHRSSARTTSHQLHDGSEEKRERERDSCQACESLQCMCEAEERERFTRETWGNSERRSKQMCRTVSAEEGRIITW